eukprot:5417512-Pleurochrysis_carterae.AAC.1
MVCAVRLCVAMSLASTPKFLAGWMHSAFRRTKDSVSRCMCVDTYVRSPAVWSEDVGKVAKGRNAKAEHEEQSACVGVCGRLHVCVCIRACVRARMRACVRACVRACLQSACV